MDSSSVAARLERCLLSLDGLSLGDAFGEIFFGSPGSARECVRLGRLPPGQWWYTDDTELALAIVAVLRKYNAIDQDSLAREFGRHVAMEPDRGYGKGTRSFCEWVNRSVHWRQAHALTFKEGSMGNGSAMRIAPLGAWFADEDFPSVARQAHLSAEVTHSHPEGIAGGIAVAIAAAAAWRQKSHDGASASASASAFIFDSVLAHTPPSKVREGIIAARELDPTEDPYKAGQVLGNGTLVSCPDTVPYVIWSACRNLSNYKEAILDTLAGGGDTDTTCAMVGGIVAMYVGREGIPQDWLDSREPLKLDN